MFLFHFFQDQLKNTPHFCGSERTKNDDYQACKDYVKNVIKVHITMGRMKTQNLTKETRRKKSK